ncbi:putative short chain oxidoreductase/dehydrogenase [Hypomontagnella monticulosa]|nr:putative short chain oxidoreductase/dehydrogenase [Hypomontagnella monticulosa]
MAETKVWLVTGASRGLGLEIVKAALKAGHAVVACYRNKAKISATAFAEVEALGGTWLELDVAGENVESQVQSVVVQYGRIDVLVNNAGYAILGSIEETSVDHINRIFNTNVVGTVRTIQAALPAMRSRHSGTIINLSSSLAFGPTPGLAIYGATKFAIEAITESLQAEVGSFGIRVLLVEPGSMDTEFQGPASGTLIPLGEAYQGTAVHMVKQFLEAPGYLDSASKPANVAQRIVEAVDKTGVMARKEVSLRLPLGKDTSSQMAKRAEMYGDLAKNMKDICESI